MYRMALMSLIASDVPGLSRERFTAFTFTFFSFNFSSCLTPLLSSVLYRCIKIALVHDIAEGMFVPLTHSLTQLRDNNHYYIAYQLND
jgi:hypothetical protein